MSSPIALVLALLLAASGTASAQNDRSAAEVIYGHKLGMALTMDVFKPDGDANGAGILHMVSGRWISSWPVLPQGAYMRRIQALVDRGFTVFAVYHGSSPRFTVPEAVEDVRKALQFVHANAADFGGGSPTVGCSWQQRRWAPRPYVGVGPRGQFRRQPQRSDRRAGLLLCSRGSSRDGRYQQSVWRCRVGAFTSPVDLADPLRLRGRPSHTLGPRHR